MKKEFSSNKKAYQMYKAEYKILMSHIIILSGHIENNEEWYIRERARYLFNRTYLLEGYLDSFYDLGIISEDDECRFYEFFKLIRIECHDLIIG